jgi:hypothetical protein
MLLRLCRSALILASLLLIAAPAFAGYEYPLKSPEIRDAFFLGQRPDNTPAKFLSKYTQHISQLQTGEHIVTDVGVLTPYAQIVQRGARDIPGDSEVQTETDLAAHPLPFVVQVTVTYALVYAGDADLVFPEGPKRDFSVELEQRQPLAALKMTKSSFGGIRRRCPCGVVIKAEFDPAKITAAPLQITVHTPDGQSISTEFNLADLK